MKYNVAISTHPIISLLYLISVHIVKCQWQNTTPKVYKNHQILFQYHDQILNEKRT